MLQVGSDSMLLCSLIYKFVTVNTLLSQSKLLGSLKWALIINGFVISYPFCLFIGYCQNHFETNDSFFSFLQHLKNDYYFQWEAQHEGIACEEFAAWKEANDPDNQVC